LLGDRTVIASPRCDPEILHPFSIDIPNDVQFYCPLFGLLLPPWKDGRYDEILP